jgi:hypothetical protein
MARILKMRGGREALKRYRRFWGIKHPPTIVRVEMPGPKGSKVLVGMGKSPALNLADGPEGRERRKIRRRHRGIVACDASGRQIFILRTGRGKRGNGRKRLVGYANILEYIPTRAIEKAGSFKRHKHWIHEMGEEGGTWPKVYRDEKGNYVFSRGSYRVGKWVIN